MLQLARSRARDLCDAGIPPDVAPDARRLCDDRPLSLLADFDELWPLIGAWRDNDKAQRLAIAAGLAMARAHLGAGHDVVAAQFSVRQSFFEAIDAIVGETSAACREIVLTGHPKQVASRFRERRAQRTRAGETDVSDNIPDDRIDDVIAWATKELRAIAAERPHTAVISTDGDIESAYLRVRDVLQRLDG